MSRYNPHTDPLVLAMMLPHRTPKEAMIHEIAIQNARAKIEAQRHAPPPQPQHQPQYPSQHQPQPQHPPQPQHQPSTFTSTFTTTSHIATQYSKT